MRYVTLSGVDGSGKSTQLTLLKQYLEQGGKRIAVFNAVEFSLANRIARFFKGKKTFKPGEEKAITEASWISIILRKKFLFIDIIRFRFLRARLKRAGYDYLLSDRSFYDSIINIEYLSLCHSKHTRGIPSERTGSFSRQGGIRMTILEKFLPVPDIAFYLDIKPESILSRERVPEQGIDYLQAKINLFRKKIHDWKLIIITADQPKEATFAEILKSVIRDS